MASGGVKVSRLKSSNLGKAEELGTLLRNLGITPMEQAWYGVANGSISEFLGLFATCPFGNILGIGDPRAYTGV